MSTTTLSDQSKARAPKGASSILDGWEGHHIRRAAIATSLLAWGGIFLILKL